MNKKGEIVIVDDDEDDRDLLIEALRATGIPNKVMAFMSAEEAMDHLRKVDADPYFILSDFRMPRINGLELRQLLYADKNLIKRSIPFILYSTTIDSTTFTTALSVGVQGFFVKPSSVTELHELVKKIVEYLEVAMGNRTS